MGGIDKITGIDTTIDGIVVGNKIGSFITQITLILGILGVSQSIAVSKWELRREGPMLFFSVFIFLIFAIDGVLSRIEGVIMIVIYILYLLLIIWSEKRIAKAGFTVQNMEKERLNHQDFEIIESPIKTSSPRKDFGLFFTGLFILLIGAEFTLLSSHNLAKELFHVFSRMEYSLKATGYNNGDGAAQANWRKFALDIEKLRVMHELINEWH